MALHSSLVAAVLLQQRNMSANVKARPRFEPRRLACG